MDATIFILLMATGLLLVGSIWYMLNRSWGDFPARVQMPPTDMPSKTRTDRFIIQSGEEVGVAETPTTEEREPLTQLDTPPEGVGGLILLEDPILKQMAQSALEQHSPAAHYVVRDGDKLYVALDRIPDPYQRQMIAKTLHAVQSGERVDVWTMLRVFGALIRR